MQPQTLDSRVERLQKRVTALEQLPSRMDALEMQFSLLRDEMRVEFAATRAEIREGDAQVTQTLRGEIQEGEARVIQTLRAEIQEGDERILTQARVLHEEVLARLATIRDAAPQRRTRR